MEGRPTGSLDSLAGDVSSHTLFLHRQKKVVPQIAAQLCSVPVAAPPETCRFFFSFRLTCFVPPIDSPLAGGQPKGHRNRTVEARRVEAGWGPGNAVEAEGPGNACAYGTEGKRGERGGRRPNPRHKCKTIDLHAELVLA